MKDGGRLQPVILHLSSIGEEPGAPQQRIDLGKIAAGLLVGQAVELGQLGLHVQPERRGDALGLGQQRGVSGRVHTCGPYRRARDPRSPQRGNQLRKPAQRDERESAQRKGRKNSSHRDLQSESHVDRSARVVI